ncbi:MAG: DNA methylase [Oscillospiraceae bacterium]|nr:DNA methylase [Oscillospiraceae bacterium]
MTNRTYIAIDLKSFYASVECVERGFDPLTTNLVVADKSRTEKTICLAVSPALKTYGISGRARLFEVVQRVRDVNGERRRRAPGGVLTGSSCDIRELTADPSLALDYIVAMPQMARYIQFSTEIYQIYLRFIAPEDIHVYSIDEVFMDVTDYLRTYQLTPHALAMKMIQAVLKQTGITATAGIGTNLYLCKIAMDIDAKHIPADKDGVRIAELDEISYRQRLWAHQPITDFWRVGRGYARRLAKLGLYTMGDIARYSLSDCGESRLYKEFGVNAELLIDHAWGWEPCRIADIKAYRPENNSISSGQVLQSPYEFEKAKLVVREMADALSMDLVDKGLETDQIVLTIGYDVENLTDLRRQKTYKGEVTTDHYGRKIPKPAHGSANLGCQTSSTRLITKAVMDLFDRIVEPNLLVRRMYVVANHVVEEGLVKPAEPEQLDLFTDYAALERKRKEEQKTMEKEKRRQKAVLSIWEKYGKDALLKGMNLEEGATGKARNAQIGGHKA